MGQPLRVNPASFMPDLSEPAQRAMSNYTGFKFTISKANVSQRLPASAVAYTCVEPVMPAKHHLLPLCRLATVLQMATSGRTKVSGGSNNSNIPSVPALNGRVCLCQQLATIPSCPPCLERAMVRR